MPRIAFSLTAKDVRLTPQNADGLDAARDRGLRPEDLDESDPWQFRNVIVR